MNMTKRHPGLKQPTQGPTLYEAGGYEKYLDTPMAILIRTAAAHIIARVGVEHLDVNGPPQQDKIAVSARELHRDEDNSFSQTPQDGGVLHKVSCQQAG